MSAVPRPALEPSVGDRCKLTQVRELVSGGCSTEQLQHDVAHMSKESREAILGEASLPVHIPVDHGLAMKSDLQLPWNKMRAIRRYMYMYMYMRTNIL